MSQNAFAETFFKLSFERWYKRKPTVVRHLFFPFHTHTSVSDNTSLDCPYLTDLCKHWQVQISRWRTPCVIHNDRSVWSAASPNKTKHTTHFWHDIEGSRREESSIYIYLPLWVGALSSLCLQCWGVTGLWKGGSADLPYPAAWPSAQWWPTGPAERKAESMAKVVLLVSKERLKRNRNLMASGHSITSISGIM